MKTKTRARAEYGDFQTPVELARQICELLHAERVKPLSIIEPTCGTGTFLVAALNRFQGAARAVGIEINKDHVRVARKSLPARSGLATRVLNQDVFRVDWGDLVSRLPDPLLVIGNPPWATNSALGIMGSSNLPAKANFLHLRGLDAITGKSNFDISEWMLMRALEWIVGRRATLAMLCKSSVARRVLLNAWKMGLRIAAADIYRIDATRHFGVSVDSCLLVVRASGRRSGFECRVHDSLEAGESRRVIAYRDRRLISDLNAYERWRHLESRGPGEWRSGIKHDCARVMLLHRGNGRYVNGLGEPVNIEDDFLFPMLKSSQIAGAGTVKPDSYMLVTQRVPGDDTERIRFRAPRTWRYLIKHGNLLSSRASAIYRNRPRFSIFGVGEYSFAPWKVAISGFHKRLEFAVVGPSGGRPVVLDDTSYFLPCRSEREARDRASLLNGEIAQEFYSSLVFWDEKRPITIGLLRSLDVDALARESRLA